MAMFEAFVGLLLFSSLSITASATSGFFVDGIARLDPQRNDPPPCLANNVTELCVNQRKLTRVFKFGQRFDGCSSQALGEYSSPQSIEAQVANCINVVRTQPTYFTAKYPCNASFLSSASEPRRSPFSVPRRAGLGLRQPLDVSAREHSVDLSVTRSLSHESPEGLGLSERVRQQNWTGFPVAEIIGAGFTNVEDLVLGWMCSKSNRRILMSCGYDTIGVGAAWGPDSSWFVTANFGCSAHDGNCLCNLVEVIDNKSASSAGIAEQSVGEADWYITVETQIIGEPAFTSEPTNHTLPPCIKNGNTSEECTNGTKTAIVPQSGSIDPDLACPDTPVSSMSIVQIANQIEECINAYRVAPDAFAGFLPCDYTFRDEVMYPRRSPLNFEWQTGSTPTHPLDVAAMAHSQDMALRNYFSHNSLDGREFSDRILGAGWTQYPMGENIAAGQVSVRDAVLGWVCSPGHRQNLMSCGYDTMGTGVAFGSGSVYGYYYTQNFACGAPRSNCGCGQVIEALKPDSPASLKPLRPPSSPSPSPSPSPSLPSVFVPVHPPSSQFGYPGSSQTPIQPPSSGSFFSFPTTPAPLSGGPLPLIPTQPPSLRDSGSTPVEKLFKIVLGNEDLSGLLNEDELASFFRNQLRGSGLDRLGTLQQSGSHSSSILYRGFLGDPLLQFGHGHLGVVPRCHVKPGKECAGAGLQSANLLANPSVDCPDTRIIGSGQSESMLAEQIENCVNSFRLDPDAYIPHLPCDFAFRKEVTNPRRAPFKHDEMGVLRRAAERHSRDLARSGFVFGHAGPMGESLDERLAALQYTTFPIGENIAAGFQSVRSLVMAWVCSPPHREVITSCAFDSFGTGVAIKTGSQIGVFMTQTYGCSEGAGTCKCTPGPVISPLPELPQHPTGMFCTSRSTSVFEQTRGTETVRSRKSIMHALNVVSGEGCPPVTSDSKLSIAVFLGDTTHRVTANDVKVTLSRAKYPMAAVKVKVEPLPHKGLDVYEITVNLPQRYSGPVRVDMTAAGETETIEVHKLTHAEKTRRMIELLTGLRDCP